MAENEDKPKIFVDDDWKRQAEVEKEKLAEEVEQGAGAGGPRELPPADFGGLVNALVTNVFFALGGMEDPQTKKRYVDLALAKHYIDLLSVLEAKVKGNITDEEKGIMDTALYECRMQYVQIAQHVSKMG